MKIKISAVWKDEYTPTYSETYDEKYFTEENEREVPEAGIFKKRSKACQWFIEVLSQSDNTSGLFYRGEPSHIIVEYTEA